MKKFAALVTAAALTLSLSGCADQGITKGTAGAGIGAASGALLGQAIGHNTQATLLGAAIGTVLGYIVGNEMDKADRIRLNEVYNSSPSGSAVAWENPDTGNSYSVVPQPAYYPDHNQASPCRKAEILATIDGKVQKTFTTACRNPQTGEWILQN
ncbi:glycine zipper 2TM domain-containing protein [Desulforhopalus vacuolatus]|uniref:glycine zipper domain-containing protein n=1 Tax=Desulforhopalus vacuolatus TaxID=40414 RepID=UPI001964279C|nr:glycine zipper domain-containing protein [Desulforhopalus vacuolatus]MBM9518440.1 glycine zipper 2TM domain-containing protein [Desulforhopalus vacuolatus]